jgi:hypothetical protein
MGHNVHFAVDTVGIPARVRRLNHPNQVITAHIGS